MFVFNVQKEVAKFRLAKPFNFEMVRTMYLLECFENQLKLFKVSEQ